eukprot:scaffold147_cov164-Ochromonas_danica.AAC.28
MEAISELSDLSSSRYNKSNFPLTPSILWDRTGIESPRSLHGATKVFPLLFTKQNIYEILKHVQSLEEGSSFDFPVHVVQLQIINQQLRLPKFATYLLQSPNYLFTTAKIEEGHHSDCTVNIPVRGPPRTSSITGGVGDREMIHSLAKAVVSGRGFALKHFMRIQALVERRSDSPSPIGRRDLSSTFRFIALVPDLSFQAVAIRPIPLQATPLTMRLTQPGSSKPRMGFLSINQTRKLVFLLDNDVAVSTAPIVGSWISFESFSGSVDSALQHPLFWAAAVRYLLGERVRERVFVAEDTFLMVLLLDGRAKFYELSILPAGSGGGLNSFRVQDMPFPMASMDFTVDLTCEDSLEAVIAAEREGVVDPVLCKFKPCAGAFTGKDLVSIPRQTKTPLSLVGRIMLDDSSMAEEPRRPQTLPMPSTSPERPKGYIQSKSDHFAPTTASPPPVSQEDDLLFIAPGTCSSLLSAVKQEQQVKVAGQGQGEAHLPYAAIMSSSALEMGVPPEALRYSFPGEVIVAQQRQIEMLQKQVLELHNLLRTITASSSAAGDASAGVTDLLSTSPNFLPVPASSAPQCISPSFQSIPPEAPVPSSTTGKDEDQSVQEEVLTPDKLPLTMIKGENATIEDCLPEQGSMSVVLESRIQQEQLQEEEDFDDDDDTFSRLPSCLIEPRSEIETESLMAIEARYLPYIGRSSRKQS